MYRGSLLFEHDFCDENFPIVSFSELLNVEGDYYYGTEGIVTLYLKVPREALYSMNFRENMDQV